MWRDFLAEYAHIVTDLPHLAAEVTFMVVVDVVLLGCAVPLLKRMFDRAHDKIDEEHGVDHDQAVRDQAMREVLQGLADLGWPGTWAEQAARLTRPQPEDQVQTSV